MVPSGLCSRSGCRLRFWRAEFGETQHSTQRGTWRANWPAGCSWSRAYSRRPRLSFRRGQRRRKLPRPNEEIGRSTSRRSRRLHRGGPVGGVQLCDANWIEPCDRGCRRIQLSVRSSTESGNETDRARPVLPPESSPDCRPIPGPPEKRWIAVWQSGECPDCDRLGGHAGARCARNHRRKSARGTRAAGWSAKCRRREAERILLGDALCRRSASRAWATHETRGPRFGGASIDRIPSVRERQAKGPRMTKPATYGWAALRVGPISTGMKRRGVQV